MSKLLKRFLFVAILTCCQNAFSQLADFTLSVAVTPETCTGNGALTFVTTGTTPQASMIYSVFLLPDTTTPMATLSANTITGLVSGEYLVVATQTLGNLTNSHQQNATVANEIVPLTFQVTGDPGNCASGTITVNAQGNVATYEIIAGPVILPPQASNIFAGIPVGTYNVRVTNTCGDALVQTYTLQGDTFMNVSGLSLSCTLVDCDTALAGFSFDVDAENHPGMTIAYPLQVTITIHPPQNAPPIVLTQTITSGSSDEYFSFVEIPFFDDFHYAYEISVTDSCGQTFVNSGNEIFETYTVGLETFYEGMESNLTIQICFGLPPYTVNFTSAPVGFNPTDFNPTHPGPFMSPVIHYNSNAEHLMPDGEYTVVITDSCGNVFTGDTTLAACATSMKIDLICPNLGHITIPGDTGVLVATANIVEAPTNFPHPLPFDLTDYIVDGQLTIDLPPGTYTITGMLVCGNEFTFHPVILEPSVVAEAQNAFGCAGNTGKLTLTLLNGIMLQSAVIVSAPAGYLQPLPYDATAGITTDDPKKCEITGLMYGDYVVHVTDGCGNLYVINVNVPLNISQDLPYFYTAAGCDPGYGSVKMVCPNGFFEQVMIIAAPSNYPFPLPHDVTFNINLEGAWSMLMLPEGDYVFYTKDLCDVEHTFPKTVAGYHVTKNEVEMLGHCGSFDLRLDFEATQVLYQTFWLQRYNPVTNQWEHPFTGAPQLPGLTPDVANAYQVFNKTINYNLAVYGHFRVMMRSQIYNNGAPGSLGWFFCVDNINEFDYTGQLRISSAYSIPCSNGNSQVVIIAGETSPLTYRITEKDGLPFLIENGQLNVFTGLDGGIYNFQVEDLCGNIVNRLFDIISLSEPQITPHDLCDGQSGFLSVLPISFLNYQWWNGNNPGNILSTSNSLYFSPFSQTGSAGTYYVRIYSPTSLSCIDTTVSYTILPSSTPNAGQDAEVTLCGGSSAINLTNLLGGTFDNTGYWTEITSSGLLNGNTWLPIGLPHGTYIFNYRVNGFCDVFDDATVTVNLQGAAPIPAISVEQESCSGGNIAFWANDILDATYHWTGPNNFVSDLQFPIIVNSTAANSGPYALTIDVNGCQQSATVQVTINTTADFDLVQSCNAGAYQLTAVPNADGFDPDTVTFSWIGPDNFTSSQNPVTVTGLPSGEYSVTVAHNGDCEVTRSIAVGATRCGIPSGISPNQDGKNDVFDLSGYGVLRFKIYNRYGRMVFEQDNYTNQWHGQDFNGRELPDATYYYYIKLDTGEEKTGWVYVTK